MSDAIPMNVPATLPGAGAAFGGFHVAEIFYGGSQWQPRHAHAETTVTMVVRGSLRESVGRTEEIARALSIVVKPGGTEHADQFGSEGATTLQIRLDAVESQRLDEAAPLLRDWRWLHGGSAVAPFLRLLRTMRNGNGDEGGDRAAEDTVYDVLASLAAGHWRSIDKAPPRWLHLVREEIDATYATGPRVRGLARAAGVHPVYLARQFRRFFGCSVVQYLKHRRLESAAQMLGASEAGIATVSLEAGFADQSHLCRVFKAGTGITPLAYRRLAR